jgi:Flp pilus assembly protein TadG
MSTLKQGQCGQIDNPRKATGQVLVLFVLGLVAMLAMLGLIIDGGYAFAQQRGAQNGTDSAATAGALVLAQNLPARAVGQPLPKSDGDVFTAVNTAATSNGLASVTAYYTDLNGANLGTTVGSGAIPAGAWGVAASGTRTFNTFFANVVGISGITAATSATAVSGYVENAGAGNVLPIAIPLDIIFCLNNGDVQTVQPSTIWPLNQHLVLPICKGNASGNVGWLDWNPPSGGTSELVQAILHPSNPAIDIPSWQFITSTGNVNSSSVEDAINKYAGQVVLIPFFDNACADPNTATNSAWPSGSGGGNGQNNWYHLPLFFGLKLDSPKGAYITGSNPECGSLWAGAGCLTGTIVNYVGPNVTVGAGSGSSRDAYSAVGVQLIH